MQVDFLTALIQVAILLAFAIPGYVLRKVKLLSPASIPTMVAILMYVNQPFLLVDSFLSHSYDENTLGNMGLVLMFSVLGMGLMLAVSKICFFKFPNQDKSKVYTYASFFSNCGFMGIPVVKMLFPDRPEALIYVAIFNIIFNILNWTLGIYLLSGDKSYISFKKAFINPATIAVIIGLPLFFCSVQMPKELMTIIGGLGDMTIPLSMMIMGLRLAEIKLKDLFNDCGTYLTCALKLFICPIIMFLLLLPFDIPQLVKIVMVLVMAMPCSITTIVFSEKVKADGFTAVRCVLLSTIISCLTIPLMMLLF